MNTPSVPRVVMLSVALASGVSKGEPGAEPSSALAELGSVAGLATSNGIVFIDGEYVQPPYLVKREGNLILINGRKIEQPAPWPIPARPKPSFVTEEAPMPSSVSISTTPYDRALLVFLDLRTAFYFQTFQQDEALKRIAATYRALPCVKAADFLRDREVLDVTWANDEVHHIRVIMPPNRAPIWTREMVLERTEMVRATYETRLAAGDYFLLGDVGGRMTGTAEGARTVLPTLLEALKMSKDAKEMSDKMRAAGWMLFDGTVSEAFFKHRNDLKDLEARVAKLKDDAAKPPGK